MKIEEKIQAWFTQAKKTLAFAESCTGGRMAAQLTAIPGASLYFLGSLVTYSNAMKHKILGVDEKTLMEFGAVSRETVLEMLDGVLERTCADVAVAVTGIAGPTGGSTQKPVGTIWVAIGERGQEPVVEMFVVPGSRLEVIERASNYIFNFLLHQVSHSSSKG